MDLFAVATFLIHFSFLYIGFYFFSVDRFRIFGWIAGNYCSQSLQQKAYVRVLLKVSLIEVQVVVRPRLHFSYTHEFSHFIGTILVVFLQSSQFDVHKRLAEFSCLQEASAHFLLDLLLL